MTKVTIHKAKTNLSKLVAKAEEGREFVVCRGHEPVAMIVPYRKAGVQRPKVGKITSPPVSVQPGCFDPVSDEDLAEWGLG
jgi:antitoxin (DNA-binding transcriptional repressor) of toxin-antitoxin stability system